MRSAILADLAALWLAGFQGENKHGVREQMLAGYVELIRKLVPENERMMMERMQAEGHG